MFVNLGLKKCLCCPQKKFLCVKECSAQEAKQSSDQESIIFLSGSGSQLDISSNRITSPGPSYGYNHSMFPA